MSLFRDFARCISCCFGGAADDTASIVHESGQQSESQPSEPSVRELIKKMQDDITRSRCQIERLRNMEKDNAEEIAKLKDQLQRSRVSYSTNYQHEEVITGLISEEDLHETETAAIPIQAITNENRLNATANSNHEDNYKMDHKNRGTFIIFTHGIFKNPKEAPPRPYVMEEANRVKLSLEKIGFEVTICKDYTCKRIKGLLYDLSKKDYSEDDCIGIYISTHGDNGTVWAKDVTYPVNIFEDKLCRIHSLVGKPKIIFIQACRGEKVDKGVGINTSEESSDDCDETDFVINHNKTPSRADRFIIYSTMPGFVSWREWMMSVFCKMLDKHGDEDFVTILTKTNNQISKYESENSESRLNEAKQICCFDMTPRKKIYFRR